jgi:FdhE protein
VQRPKARGRRALVDRAPEWGPWIALLNEVSRAIDEPPWTVTARSPGWDDDTPAVLTHDLDVDPRALAALMDRLARHVPGMPRGIIASDADARVLVMATVRNDTGALDRLAARGGGDPGRVRTLAGVAVVPLLHGIRRAVGSPPAWGHGYCPICGAWPVLGEYRGLERQRRLRCFRCGGDWATNWLSCVFCGERDHTRLGSLVPEADIESLKVETCDTCRGALKTVTTLGALSFLELALRDLDTVDLDLAALERGFARPAARTV